jgi:ribosome-binding factor A
VSRRSEQLASTIRRGVQEILTRGLQDPRVSGLITVTGVRLDEDLEEAVVSVSILPEEREELVMHGLRSAQAHVRHALSEMVDLRRMPRITFRLDRSAKREAAVLRSLARVAEERARRGAEPPPQPRTEPEP